MKQRLNDKTAIGMETCQVSQNRSEIFSARGLILKMWAIFFFVLVWSFSTPAMATVYKRINFEWEYDTDLPGLAGYILYQNGRYLQTIHDPAVLSVDLNIGLTPGKTTVFTMKAFDVNGNESAMSAPYRLKVPAAVENNNFVPTPLQAVWFSGLASTAPDGKISQFYWDFGDGTSGTGAITLHRYWRPGTYTVTLTVWDEQGVSSQKSSPLTVTRPSA